jgi:hypothetical protein
MTTTIRLLGVDGVLDRCGELCGEVGGQSTLPERDGLPMMRRSKSAKGKEGVPEDRIAQLAIDFISFCFTRRSVEWPLLYDEMCFVASNRLYRGMGYGELRDAGLDLTLGGLVRTSRIANEVTREMRIGNGQLRGGLLAAS